DEFTLGKFTLPCKKILAVELEPEIASSLKPPLLLEPRGENFSLTAGGSSLGLVSTTALITVMRRYARPLDTAFDTKSESMQLAPGTTLFAWYYRAPVDLEDKLYLVLVEAESPPIAVLSRQVANALRFLCNANNS
ncbi:MAG: hypothetical protein JKY56_21785, partial [Kofleriaceae bacterium]|nr:hypothetical protein [Kofleriaceae bacterium]